LSYTPGATLTEPPATSTFLLPAFDEYTVAYKNRNDVLDPEFAAACNFGLKPIVVHNSQITGTWLRTEKKDGIHIETTPFPKRKIPARAIAVAIKKYTAFSNKARS